MVSKLFIFLLTVIVTSAIQTTDSPRKHRFHTLSIDEQNLHRHYTVSGNHRTRPTLESHEQNGNKNELPVTHSPHQHNEEKTESPANQRKKALIDWRKNQANFLPNTRNTAFSIMQNRRKASFGKGVNIKH